MAISSVQLKNYPQKTFSSCKESDWDAATVFKSWKNVKVEMVVHTIFVMSEYDIADTVHGNRTVPLEKISIMTKRVKQVSSNGVYL